MTVSKLPQNQKKYKTALFRRRIIERLRLEMLTERQVLTQPTPAGRVNRTLKENRLQNRSFVNFESAQQAVGRAVGNYNSLRPHGSCNYHPPERKLARWPVT